jgi:hypothetical protein
MLERGRFAIFDFVLLCGLLLGSSVDAKTSFDGNWLVRVIGDAGECRVAYSLLFHIIDGRITYAGSSRAAAEGTVRANGNVSLRIANAGDELRALGTLAGKMGNGEWTSAADGCGGTWTARKTS